MMKFHIYKLQRTRIIINMRGQMTKALGETGLFAGQTGNTRAENVFASLILIGCRDVKQLCSANEILRIPFQCQSCREWCYSGHKINYMSSKSHVIALLKIRKIIAVRQAT